MSDAIAFTVPGAPRGKGRPRFGRTKTGAPVTFTDAKTASYENLVALACQQAMRGAKPSDGPVVVSLRARFMPPKSVSKATRAAMLDGRWPPVTGFDVDNIAKACLDGINRIAFVDDKQVVELTATKVYADTAGVDVLIKPYRPEVR